MNTNNEPYDLICHDDEVDVRELLKVIWHGKWVVIATTILSGIIAVYMSLKMPDIYKSTAMLISSTGDEQSGTAALASRFGGLASLAGVSLGGGGADKTQMAIEILKSHRFISQFIEKHNIKPEIMAVKLWDVKSNRLVFDSDVYNEQSKEWNWNTRSQWKHQQQPTDQEATKKFLSSITISKEESSGLVNISASHLSPFVAKQWVQWLIDDINQHMREQDIAESEKSIGYLKAKLERTSLANMQKIFYELIEAQTKTKMLAEIRDQYVLRIIDPPRVPELKDKPKRALICIFAVFFGGVVGVVLVFLRKMLILKRAIKP